MDDTLKKNLGILLLLVFPSKQDFTFHSLYKMSYWWQNQVDELYPKYIRYVLSNWYLFQLQNDR